MEDIALDIEKRISSCGLVPVVVIDDASTAVATANAMLAGGVDIMEITLRTPAGLNAIQQVADNCPDTLVGAGTVTTLQQCKQAVENGAKFIVSPGYDAEIVEFCVQNQVNVYPGCVTPTEITTAIKAGLTTLKFFPANVYGGVKAIKALSGPFPNLKFIPTGGVSLSNLAEFAIPQVAAVGGGWLCSREDIRDGNFSAITEVCKQSVAILKKISAV